MTPTFQAFAMPNARDVADLGPSPAEPCPAPRVVARVDAASVSFGARLALDRVSFAIRAGEVYALLGPNGAGKSTLMRTLCGQIRPSSGSVSVEGADPAQDPRARAAIGFVPQDVALYPKLTVRENLSVFADFADVPRSEARAAVDDAIGRVRAREIADRPVEVLSGGNQRRANIAAALLGRPRLLVLDEPTVGVDADARRAVDDVVRGLCADGVAILMTTHDFDQAEAVADRAGFLAAGRLVREGPISVLVDETFGAGAQEVSLTLARELTGAEQAALGGLGFRRSVAGDRAWFALKPGPEQALAAQHLLRRAGIPVKEAWTRAPGLASLYERILCEGLSEERRP